MRSRPVRKSAGRSMSTGAPVCTTSTTRVMSTTTQNPMAPTKYGVRSIPTLLMFKNGQVAATKIGAEPKQRLVTWINSVL